MAKESSMAWRTWCADTVQMSRFFCSLREVGSVAQVPPAPLDGNAVVFWDLPLTIAGGETASRGRTVVSRELMRTSRAYHVDPRPQPRRRPIIQ